MTWCGRSSVCPSWPRTILGIPDACLMFFDEVLAFDHVRKQILLIVTADLARQKPAAAYADAKSSGWRRLEKRLARPIPRASGTLHPGQTLRHQPDAQEGFSGLRGQDQGVHRGRRHLPGRAFAAL